MTAAPAAQSTTRTARTPTRGAATTRAGALGGKALGASGGGCVVVMAADGREGDLAAALAPLGDRLAYTIDEQGFHVVAALAAAGPT